MQAETSGRANRLFECSWLTVCADLKETVEFFSRNDFWLWHGPHGGALREVFGNPFRPVTFDPAWLTSDVLALARGIYEERAFDRMPILADALQDAGCECDDILNHCRDANATHVRGCWALDLVLGKA